MITGTGFFCINFRIKSFPQQELINDKRAAYISQRYPGKVFAIHPDHLGSTTLLTNNEGEIKSKRLYTAFGRPLQTSFTGEQIDMRYGFGGSEEDSEVGLLHLGVRQYDPEIARML